MVERTRFRVLVIETTTITRETYIVARSGSHARELAEEQDWREWAEIATDTNAEIVQIDRAED